MLTIRREVRVVFRVRVASEVPKPHVETAFSQCERQVPVVVVIQMTADRVHQPGVRTVHESVLQ